MQLHEPIYRFNPMRYPAGDLTQGFGENPQLYQRFGMLSHNGIDIVRPHGTPLLAVEGAEVVAVENDPAGFGKHVRLLTLNRDEQGRCREWTYAHNSENLVKVGDIVEPGQVIALMGNTGFVISGATPYWEHNPYAGTHLHLGLRFIHRLRPDEKGGWRYAPGGPRVKAINYENGHRGAVDPAFYLQNLATTSRHTTLREVMLITVGAMNKLISLLR